MLSPGGPRSIQVRDGSCLRGLHRREREEWAGRGFMQTLSKIQPGADKTKM